MDNSGFTSPPPPPPPPSEGPRPPAGELPLAPRAAGQVIGDAFSTFTKHWSQLLLVSVIYAIVVVVIGVIAFAVVAAVASTGSGLAMTIGILLVLALVIVAIFSLAGFVTRLVASEVAGVPTTIRDSLDWGMRHFGSIILISLLVAAVIIGIELVGFLLLYLLRDIGLLAALFGLAFYLSLIVVQLGLSMAVPAYVVEGMKGSAALTRSWNLVKPNFWHALGVFVLAYLVMLGGWIVVTIFAQVSELLGGLLALAVAFVVLPFFSLVFVLLYVNLRVKAGGVTRGILQQDLARTA